MHIHTQPPFNKTLQPNKSIEKTSSNKTAVITGVSSGIGPETAQLLAEPGARAFGTARDPHSAMPIHGVELLRLAVEEGASLKKAAQNVARSAGPVQFPVNNAGYALTGALEETSGEGAGQQSEASFFGVIRATNAILTGMRQLGQGPIVNISSALGFVPGPYWIQYE